MQSDRQQVVRRSVAFTVLVTILAWLGPVLGGDPVTPGLGFLVWGSAPLVACLIIRAITRDWKDLGIKPALRNNGRWYLISLLAYPVAIALVVGLGTLFGASSIRDFSVSAFLQAMLPAAVIYLVFAIFEEFGWRGYLAPKLYSLGLNPLLAHALVGVIWASWHFPYIRELSTYTTESLAVYLLRFIIGCIAFTLTYGEIRIRTQSVWPAVLMHWIGNTIANPLLAGFLTLTPGLEFLGSFGVDGLLMIVLFGGLGLALLRSREAAGKLLSTGKRES